MIINESATDRVIRVVIGLVLLAAWVFGWTAGGWTVAAAIVGAVLVLTGIVGFCPLYRLVNASTAPRKKA
jgi:hypothetical protein